MSSITSFKNIIFWSLLLINTASIFFPVYAKQQILLPELQNKTPITLVAEQGFWTDYIQHKLIKEFTRKTGVKVNVVSLPLSNMHQVENAALKQGEGRFDLLTIEAGWAKEWAANGYTFSIDRLVETFDPKDRAFMINMNQNYYPALIDILSYQGELHSIPYNSYVMGNHYRADLFASSIEQKSFLTRYGYPLSPPKELQQLADIAAFFTRSKGDMLNGKKLLHDFYGVALMSGNRPHVNDELSSILWGGGGKWFEPQYEKNSLIGFHVASNSAQAKKAAQYYVDLMQYAHPTDKNFAFMESAQALNEGRVAMWPFAYNNLWSISGKVNKSVKGAMLGISEVAGGKPYHGAYSFAVSYDSKNPEAAYWLLKYLSSYQSQIDYANAGGNPTRLDVINHLIETLPITSPQRQALLSSLEGDKNWRNLTHLYGHYSSTAMGHIYEELQNSAYQISQHPNEIDKILRELTTKIVLLQNIYGQEAMLAE